MTDGGHRCGVCEAQTRADRFVCRPCIDRTVRQLGAVPALLRELGVTVTRQHRFRVESQRVRGTTDGVVPFHVAASRRAADLSATLRREAALVAEVHGWSRPSGAVAAAGFLAGVADWIATRPAGPHFVETIDRACSDAWAVIDRPVDRRYVGACPTDDCPGTLYQHGTRPMARCSTCHAEAEAEPRRDAMRDQLAGMVFTAAECERLTAELGQRVDARKVRVWASRGRLPNRGGPDAPRYLLGDVLALAGGAA